MQNYDLYIANKNYSSWSLRPWVLMRARRIPFTEHLVRFQGTANAEQFRRFSPNGKVPCLVDAGTTVWDSLAITEYLAERHAGVWPASVDARAWSRSAAAEMHSGFGSLRTLCSMTCGMRVRLHHVAPDLRVDLARIDELWMDGLTRFGGPWLAGSEYTVADAFFAPVAFRVQTYDLSLPAGALAYVARQLAHPAMQEWYQSALQETFRDEGHESHTQQAGTVLADLREPPTG